MKFRCITSPPQLRYRGLDQASVIDETRLAVAASSSGPSRSVYSARAAASSAGAMASEVPTMQPAIAASPCRRAAAKSSSAAVSRRLVELDVDGLVELSDGGRPAAVCRLSSAQTAMPRRATPRSARTASLPAGSGCSISFTPAAWQAAKLPSSEVSSQPSLASAISGLRRAAPHRRDALRVTRRAQLDLEQGAGCLFACRRFHGLQRAQAQRIRR